MAYSVNCSVNMERSQLQYDVSSSDLEGLKKKNFSFVIRPEGQGQEVAVFQAVSNDGNLLRENSSLPFPAGAISKSSSDLSRGQYIVKVKRNDNTLNLGQYFE